MYADFEKLINRIKHRLNPRAQAPPEIRGGEDGKKACKQYNDEVAWRKYNDEKQAAQTAAGKDETNG